MYFVVQLIVHEQYETCTTHEMTGNIVHLQLTTLFSCHFQAHKENLFAEIELIPVSITTNILVAMVTVLLSILVVLVHIFGWEVFATQ